MRATKVNIGTCIPEISIDLHYILFSWLDSLMDLVILWMSALPPYTAQNPKSADLTTYFAAEA
jgi:hypothetical protein